MHGVGRVSKFPVWICHLRAQALFGRQLADVSTLIVSAIGANTASRQSVITSSHQSTSSVYSCLCCPVVMHPLCVRCVLADALIERLKSEIAALHSALQARDDALAVEQVRVRYPCCAVVTLLVTGVA